MLTNESLDNLLVLDSDKILLKHFSIDTSIDLWYAVKTGRPSQIPGKEYMYIRHRRNRSAGHDDDSEKSSDSEAENLDAKGQNDTNSRNWW